MTIRPIDIKTNLMGNFEASNLRETQKVQEAGLAGNVTQNKDADEKKSESVQGTEATESKVIRKEDEEEENEKNKAAKKQQDKAEAKKKESEAEKKKEERPKIPDHLRGLKIDVKV